MNRRRMMALGMLGGGGDAVAPSVASFAATTPNIGGTIAITEFTASEVDVLFLITESDTPPLPNAEGWSATIPEDYVASDGSCTLYPWVKDAAGNVSDVYGSPVAVEVYETPAYSNAGGTGDRHLIIRGYASATLFTTRQYLIYATLDGTNNDSIYPENGIPLAGEYVAFDFYNPVIITEAKFYATDTTAQGVWKWQGSNNGSDWDDIGGNFAMAGSTTGTVQTTLSANITPYRLYRLLGVSGNSNWNAYWRQFEFKIGNKLAPTNLLRESWRTVGADLFSLQSKVGVTNPVFTAAMVTDVSLGMVADPFIIKDLDTYYMFFEGQAADFLNQYLFCATSADLLTWTYKKQIVKNPGGAFAGNSYPQVFNVDGYWYMINFNAFPAHEIYLFQFKQGDFPLEWEPIQALITDNDVTFGDPTIFQWGGVWYIVVADVTNSTSRLFYCSTLKGTWEEHPESPFLSGTDHTRPGGKPIVRPGVGVDFIMQDDNPTYGNAVRIMRFTNLTTTTVTATELPTSPLLTGTGGAGEWNKDGMHHVDRIGQTISIVDGYIVTGGHQIYSIGVYEDTP